MRPSSRGGGALPPQTSIFFMLSCLASLYVIGRYVMTPESACTACSRTRWRHCGTLAPPDHISQTSVFLQALERATGGRSPGTLLTHAFTSIPTITTLTHCPHPLQREEIAALAAVASDQRTLLRQADATIKELSSEEGPMFFSVRPNPPKEIHPLKGALLDMGKVVSSGAVDGSDEGPPVAPPDAAAAAAVAQIDFIERGEVRGWACSRSGELQGPLSVEIYVNDVRVATVAAAAQGDDLPASVKEACMQQGTTPGAAPKRFVAALPLLPQGEHLVSLCFYVYSLFRDY
jgi:hypothetical protein